MMYLLAILFPPVAVLMVGKPIQALINFFLSLLLWVPGVIHAILVVNESKSDIRMVKQVKLQRKLNNK
ncbi:YqaE/Pmp3 family membrane protein [Oceanobacillus saliphilus]|uniref:YqaE/Pmp3 family membrane protein n=1 Tax=Oceanobacillus saliphilus TaxID=2925834 RepID=UPI00201E2AAD|nr:YqaE/Pmp3 family membrane protein [Oceanobacillus saliphilus]